MNSPFILMPKGTAIYLENINNDEILYINFIMCDKAKTAYNSVYFLVSVFQ
jgi:hypothetical protein